LSWIHPATPTASNSEQILVTRQQTNSPYPPPFNQFHTRPLTIVVDGWYCSYPYSNMKNSRPLEYIPPFDLTLNDWYHWWLLLLHPPPFDWKLTNQYHWSIDSCSWINTIHQLTVAISNLPPPPNNM
jgi:hypothetical protein